MALSGNKSHFGTFWQTSASYFCGPRMAVPQPYPAGIKLFVDAKLEPSLLFKLRWRFRVK